MRWFLRFWVFVFSMRLLLYLYHVVSFKTFLGYIFGRKLSYLLHKFQSLNSLIQIITIFWGWIFVFTDTLQIDLLELGICYGDCCYKQATQACDRLFELVSINSRHWHIVWYTAPPALASLPPISFLVGVWPGFL